jgi:inner membrane protein
MPSAFAHAAAGLAIGAALRPSSGVDARWWIAGAVCAALPDLDVLAFGFGIPYGAMLGHRGLSHSLAFAAVLAAAVTWLAFRGERWTGQRGRVFAYLFLATASHGLLDAMTDGGLGVAVLAPFSGTRYFFAFRPIRVSPIGLGRFFTEKGLAVIRSELVWVFVPSLALAATAEAIRRLATPSPRES